MRNRFVMLLFSALICFSLILNSVNLSPVQAESQPYNPSVFAMSSLSDWGNSITSYGWPLGNVVTFSIYHSYPGDPYYSSDQIEVTNTVTEDPTNTIIVINLPKETYAILPSDTIVMTDGTVTKTVVVSLLQFTKIDYANDIVEGIADPGTRIDMWACDQMTNYCVNRHIDTPPDGNLNQKWSVDFSQPGSEPQEIGTIRLMASTWLNSVQNDTDGDGTNFGVGLNGPSINVFAGLPEGDSGLNANGWEFGKTLYLTIIDPSTGNVIYSDERVVENYTDYDPNLTHASFNYQHDVVKILPGYIVRLNDGTIYKETIVTGLIFQKMDFTHDTISGIGEPEKRVNVWACNEQNFYANRHAYANSKGEWIVDFSQPGTEYGEYDLLDLKGGFWANSNQRETNYDGDYTYFGNSAPNSRFEVRPNYNQIFAYDWPVGNTIYVDIDDPHNGQGTDFSTSGVSQLGTPWDPNQPQPYLVFDLNGSYDIQSGDVITLYDEVNSKTTIVSSLSYSEFDLENDVVTGKAEAGVYLDVGAGNAGRHVIVDDQGNWTAYFGIPGDQDDEKTLANLDQGMWLDARWIDQDTDSTAVAGYILNPRIEVDPNGNWIAPREWPAGTEVTLEIDDITNGPGTDYSATGIMHLSPDNPGDPTNTLADFEWPDSLLPPYSNYVITVTGSNGVSETYAVAPLTLTSYDLAAKTLSGTATPLTEVWVNANVNDRGVNRFTQSDVNGNWTVDFSQPGAREDEQEIITNLQGSWGALAEADAYWNRTLYDWGIPKYEPVVYVVSDSSQDGNKVIASGWKLGETLYLEIDDPTTLITPDYTEQLVVSTIDPNNPTNTWDIFNLQNNEFKIHPGLSVVVHDSSITKSVTVSKLQFQVMDITNDIVSGIADANKRIDIWACDPTWICINRHTISDETTGEWAVNFSQPGTEPGEEVLFDLVGGTWVNSAQKDDDGDHTSFGKSIPNPRIWFNKGSNVIHGDGWSLGDTLELTIEDLHTTDPIDYSDTQTVVVNSIDPSQTFFEFAPGKDNFTILPDQVITVTNGTITKSLVISDFNVISFNEETDTIYGTATNSPLVGTWINISDENTYDYRETNVENNSWSIDFSGVIDLHPWVSGGMAAYDNDSDFTLYQWRVARPIIEAWVSNNSIDFFDWPYQTELTIVIDDPATPQTQDFQTTKIVTDTHPFWQAPMVHLVLGDEFKLRAGMVVTSTGAGQTVSLTIAPLEVTGIDIENETVSGTATPGASVRVYDWVVFVTRLATADENGNWIADFHDSADIVAGDTFLAVIRSPEFNSTFFEAIAMDKDKDGVWDTEDNAPLVSNPDQLDTDGDDIADVIDPCPALSDNLCDISASASSSIDESGGQLTNQDRSVGITIPADSLTTATSIGITEVDTDYPGGIELTYQGYIQSILSVAITPHRTQFNLPVEVVFHWVDEDGDGLVDGTNLNETELVISKDDSVLTGTCAEEILRCNQSSNTFKIYIEGLSHFVLGVKNHLPVAELVSAPIDPVVVNSAVSATVWFSDPDIGDTHLVTWDWGDNTTSTGIVNEVNGSASGSHAYAIPGVYTVIATVTDFGGESSTASFNYIVVYDPNGGFITGGGWAMTSPGDYTGNPTLSGKVNFGFDSKYHKFALFPKGNTRLDFKLANMDFKSTSYYWMFVDVAKAQIRGSGTINGSGDYGFIVTIIDGKLLNGSNLDYFRMKIWNKSTGEVIYDNQPGAADNADPTMLIKGGSITIHNK